MSIYSIFSLKITTQSTHNNSLKTTLSVNNLITTFEYLEESDDDDEFENTNDDKFLIEGKELRMTCYYNYRFKKWVPSKIVKTGKLCNLYELREMEKNNFGQSTNNQKYSNNNNQNYKQHRFKKRFQR